MNTIKIKGTTYGVQIPVTEYSGEHLLTNGLPSVIVEVDLVREPENKFNPKAIRVEYSGRRIGYVDDEKVDEFEGISKAQMRVTDYSKVGYRNKYELLIHINRGLSAISDN